MEALEDGKMERGALAAVAERWMSFWRRASLADFDAVHSERFVDHSAAGRSADRDGLRLGVVELYGAFPDFMAESDVVAIDTAEGLVTIRWTATGHCQAPFLGVAARGQMVRFTGMELIRIVQGRVMERWGEWDEAAILAQLKGVLPS